MASKFLTNMPASDLAALEPKYPKQVAAVRLLQLNAANLPPAQHHAMLSDSVRQRKTMLKASAYNAAKGVKAQPTPAPLKDDLEM